MYFNQTANKNGIIQMQEKITGIGLAGISGNTAQMAFFTELTNKWLHIVDSWIRFAAGEWHHDDSNQSDLPILTASFVASQDDYSLETDTAAIRKVEIHDATKTEPEGWLDLAYDELAYIPNDPFGGDASMPDKYRFIGRSIIFRPKPDTAKANKYRLTVDRDAVVFTTASTNTAPGFSQRFHWLLVYGPSMEWAMINGKKEVVKLCKQEIYGEPGVPGLKRALELHYQHQNKNFVRQISREQPSGKRWR